FRKLTSNAKAYFLCACQRWVTNQVEAEQVAILNVVGTSGELNWPATLEAPAVAGLRVAKIFTTFVGGAGSDLFHVTKFRRLVGQLCQESGLTQVGINFKLYHRLLYEGQVFGAPGRRAVRHELSEFVVCNHVHTPQGELEK